MKDLHYFAAWTDGGCLLGCFHEHKTVTSAAACVSSAGGYVVAVENGKLRELNEVEEAEFQRAMCNSEPIKVDPAEESLLIRVSMLIRIQIEPGQP
jgi:hypothetical protein